MFKSYLKNKFFIFVNYIFSLVFILSITRILGPYKLGIYYMFFAVSGIFASFFDLGIIPILNEYYFKERKVVLYIIKKIILVYLIFLPIIFFLGKFFIAFTFKSNKYLIYLFLAYLYSFIQILINVFNYIYYLSKKYELINKYLIFLLFKKIILSLFALFGVFYLIILNIFLDFISLFLIFKVNKYFSYIKYKEPKISLKILIKYNILSFTSKLYYWIDSLIIGMFLNFNEVGIYGLSNKIYNAIYNLFDPSLFLIKNLKFYNPKDLINLIRKIQIILFLYFLIVIIGWKLFGKFIILFLFGKEYEKVYDYSFYLFILLLFSARGLITLYFNIKGFVNYIIIMILTLVILNSILDLILIKYRVVGAIMATIISIFLQYILGIVLVMKLMSSEKNEEGATN